MMVYSADIDTWTQTQTPMLCYTRKGRYLKQLCQLVKDLHIQSESHAGLDSLLGQPGTQAAGVAGHDQIDALPVDAIVMQLADP